MFVCYALFPAGDSGIQNLQIKKNNVLSAYPSILLKWFLPWEKAII